MRLKIAPFVHRALLARARRRTRGFTLMEMLAVMLIIGLLLALAMPSYRGHLQRAQRAQAAAALLQAQQFMERIYSVQGTYQPDGLMPTLPAALQSVSSEGRELYRLSVERADASTYRLQAQPQAALGEEPCGTLTLDHLSVKGRSGSGATVQECWR